MGIIGTNRILSLAEVQVFGREQMSFTAPSTLPSSNLSAFPTGILSTSPSDSPSTLLSSTPSSVPSRVSSTTPSVPASILPSSTTSSFPSTMPSAVSSILPSSVPTKTPSVAPSPLLSSPPSMPLSFECEDSPLPFKFKKPDGGKTKWKTCSEWVANNVADRCLKINERSCPKTCGTCDKCVDSRLKFKIQVDGVTKKTT